VPPQARPFCTAFLFEPVVETVTPKKPTGGVRGVIPEQMHCLAALDNRLNFITQALLGENCLAILNEI
jgi:hypothetical protein